MDQVYTPYALILYPLKSPNKNTPVIKITVFKEYGKYMVTQSLTQKVL